MSTVYSAQQQMLYGMPVEEIAKRVAACFDFEESSLTCMCPLASPGPVRLDMSVSLDTNRKDDLVSAFDREQLLGNGPLIKDSGCVVRAGDVFAGAGGFGIGLRQAAAFYGLNVEVEAAVEMDPAVLAIYQRNLGPNWARPHNAAMLVDYALRRRSGAWGFTYKPEILDTELANRLRNVDLLIGGPPCQGHSGFNNNRRSGDARNELYLTAVAFAVASDARAVVFENVPGIEADASKVVDIAVSLLETAGYRVGWRGTLGAAEYGVPQVRRRHFLIAARDSTPDLERVSWFFRRAERSLEWAIGDLEGRAAPQEDIFNTSSTLSEENRKRVNYLFEHNLYDMPDHIRPDCHKNGHTYPAVYGRLRWDAPAQTITQGFYSPGRGRFIHPRQERTLTPHEAARVQSFPDSFDFVGDVGGVYRRHLAKAIGEAVPPWLGRVAIAAALDAIQ